MYILYIIKSIYIISTNMKTINEQQNTESWLEARRSIIGGSDVAGIMDISPFTTPHKIWLSKIGVEEEKDNTFILEKGHRLEDVARAKLELRLGIDLPPIVARHSEEPWMKVSLDGASLQEKVQVEIKYQGEKDFTALKDEEKIPPYYMVQVQYQLMVTGFEFSYYCAINDEKEICFVKVFPDKDLMEKIFNATNHFYQENMLKKVAPGLTSKDSVKIEDESILNALLTLKKVEAILSEGKEKKEKLKALLSSKMTHCKMHSEVAKLSKSITKSGKESLRITF